MLRGRWCRAKLSRKLMIDRAMAETKDPKGKQQGAARTGKVTDSCADRIWGGASKEGPTSRADPTSHLP